MRIAAILCMTGALVLCACAGPGSLAGERTVFFNPYDLDRAAVGQVGPACDDRVIDRQGCFYDGALVGPNRIARDLVTGELVHVSRQDARQLRERAEVIRAAIEARDEAEKPVPIPPSAPPIAAPANAPLASPPATRPH